jgi:hypothetical protein
MGHVARMGEMSAYSILFGKPEGRGTHPNSPPHELGWEGLDWMHLDQEPVAGCCEHGNEPLGSIKAWVFPDQRSDY